MVERLIIHVNVSKTNGESSDDQTFFSLYILLSFAVIAL